MNILFIIKGYFVYNMIFIYKTVFIMEMMFIILQYRGMFVNIYCIDIKGYFI